MPPGREFIDTEKRLCFPYPSVNSVNIDPCKQTWGNFKTGIEKKLTLFTLRDIETVF